MESKSRDEDHINSVVPRNLNGDEVSIPPVPSSSVRKSAFVIVDPWSTGTALCKEVIALGHSLIVLWLDEKIIRSTTLPADEVIIHSDLDYAMTVTRIKNLRNTSYEINGILPGSETGVLLAEKLSYTLNLPTNPPQKALARRNKYLMGEALREDGVRSVYQTIATDFKDVNKFIAEWNPSPFKVILKPNMGAGSDDVFLCTSLQQVEQRFAEINNKINSLGLRNEGVLVQEYLDGVEYVIDTISHNKQHKVVGLWEYDKRPVNNRFNVYFGNVPLLQSAPNAPALIKYVYSVLDALDFHNGPAHAEVKMTKTGPCLVEVGARCHGGDGTWVPVANATWNTNQLTATLKAFTNNTFNEVPFEKAEKYGLVLDLVAYENGVVESTPGEAFVKGLKSLYELRMYDKFRKNLVKTVDCNTSPGQVVLVQSDRDQVMKDYNAIHELVAKKDGFFVLKRE